MKDTEHEQHAETVSTFALICVVLVGETDAVKPQGE